jgi:hypothetical protein
MPVHYSTHKTLFQYTAIEGKCLTLPFPECDALLFHLLAEAEKEQGISWLASSP